MLDRLIFADSGARRKSCCVENNHVHMIYRRGVCRRLFLRQLLNRMWVRINPVSNARASFFLASAIHIARGKVVAKMNNREKFTNKEKVECGRMRYRLAGKINSAEYDISYIGPIPIDVDCSAEIQNTCRPVLHGGAGSIQTQPALAAAVFCLLLRTGLGVQR